MKKIFTLLAVLLLASTACRAAIIISQYYEGASNNKWIELFNTGASAVDLAAGSYRLGCWSNSARQSWKTGATANGGDAAISGTINAGATLVLKNANAALPAYAVGVANAGVSFNGDDSVVLYTGTSGTGYNSANIVDVFGVTVTGSAGSPFAEHSYSRKTTIATGTTSDFDANDWVNYTLTEVENAASNEIAYIGYHVIPEPGALVAPCLLALLLRRK